MRLRDRIAIMMLPAPACWSFLVAARRLAPVVQTSSRRILVTVGLIVVRGFMA